MAIAGQLYSGSKYQVLLGRQTAASSAVNMGTAGSTNSEFVELDMATVSDIDFAGGLVTDRTLRTGQQVKKATDHWVSEKGSTKTFNFEWVCSHKEGVAMLLEMITEDTEIFAGQDTISINELEISELDEGIEVLFFSVFSAAFKLIEIINKKVKKLLYLK